jgi:hypothetical protein
MIVKRPDWPRCQAATPDLARVRKSCYKPTLRQKQQPQAMLPIRDTGESIFFVGCMRPPRLTGTIHVANVVQVL